MNPLRDRRHALLINDEEHIPARRRDVGFSGQSRPELAESVDSEFQIHKPLFGITRMGCRHWSNQLHPLDLICLGRMDLDSLPVMYFGGRAFDERTRAFEEVRRMV